MATYSDFIQQLSQSLKVSEKEAKVTADAFIQTVHDFIKHGESVSLQGLGKFEIKRTKKEMAFGFMPHAKLEKCLNYAVAYEHFQKAADDLGLPKRKPSK